MQTWPKAPVENASSKRREKHTIERAVNVSCSESQESPASSKEKASNHLDQWKACAREVSAISRHVSAESPSDGCAARAPNGVRESIHGCWGVIRRKRIGQRACREELTCC